MTSNFEKKEVFVINRRVFMAISAVPIFLHGCTAATTYSAFLKVAQYGAEQFISWAIGEWLDSQFPGDLTQNFRSLPENVQNIKQGTTVFSTAGNPQFTLSIGNSSIQDIEAGNVDVNLVDENNNVSETVAYPNLVNIPANTPGGNLSEPIQFQRTLSQFSGSVIPSPMNTTGIEILAFPIMTVDPDVFSRMQNISAQIKT